MTLETELKLQFKPSEQTQIQQHLTEMGIELMPETHMVAQYFDTPDLRLRKEGLGLRVRKEWDQWMQTIKSTGSTEGAVHVRHERNVAVESQNLDLTKLPVKGKLGKVFESASLRKQLTPVVVTDVHRQIGRWAPDDETVVEVAIDVGQVRADQQHSPIHELEFELLRGQPAAMYALAHQLSQSFHLMIQPLNKAELGFTLMSPMMASPVFAELPKLDESMTAEAGFCAVMEGCLTHFHGNYLAVIQGDVEGIHQMRVGLRRLRSCLSVYKKLIPVELTESIHENVQWLNEELGQIRDWDVFIDSMQAVQAHFPDRKGLTRISTLGDSIRSMHHAQLVARLRSHRYHRWVLELGDWIFSRRWNESLRRKQRMRILQPIEDYAHQLLKQHHKKLVQSGDSFETLSIEAKHNLRIRVKRLRYALQFFNQLCHRKSPKAMLRCLGTLQDDLGQLNDFRTVTHLLNEIGMSHTNPNRALLEGWYGARQQPQLNHASDSWKLFMRAPLPW